MKRAHQYIAGGGAIIFIGGLVAARLYLNVWLLEYVNHVLANIKGYQGSVEAIDIDLYRGAYRIHRLKLMKENGNVPVPFVDIEKADLSLQWGALLHGRIVSNVDLLTPVINFAVNPAGDVTQTGAGVDWTKPIKDLMPIDINLVTFREGQLTYRDFSTNPKVNIYITHMQGESRNLRNVVSGGNPLPSELIVDGDSIGGGRLHIKGNMNILKEIPDMDLDTTLENVHLAALSNYSNAYAAIDIKSGDLNVYSEFIVKNNHVSGYIKPIATHVSIIDLRKSTNPIKLAWEAVVSTIVQIFTNLPKDQFATRIPLDGDLNNIDTDTWSAVAGIIRNAFIQSFKKGLNKDIEFNAAPDQ